jgi:hypothetical protein
MAALIPKGLAKQANPQVVSIQYFACNIFGINISGWHRRVNLLIPEILGG